MIRRTPHLGGERYNDLDEETKKKMLNRDIEDFKDEIAELSSDLRRVRNNLVREFIEDRMDTRNRMIEKREFELWKLLQK
ncbi:hypothetical protein [Sporosarcina sp. FSL W7-1283]|uniref:hypothetical protein n=1 Tax=Sporosarcina sp. FSL W7-1283 TaxID=2921560 RepID=UPI0030FA73D9